VIRMVVVFPSKEWMDFSPSIPLTGKQLPFLSRTSIVEKISEEISLRNEENLKEFRLRP